MQEAIKLFSFEGNTEMVQLAIDTLTKFRKPDNFFNIQEEIENLHQVIKTMEDRFKNIFLDFQESNNKHLDSLYNQTKENKNTLAKITHQIQEFKKEILTHAEMIKALTNNNFVVRDFQDELEKLVKKVNGIQDCFESSAVLERTLSEQLQRMIPDISLVIGRARTGVVLNEAISKAKEKLVIVCPWLNRKVIDSAMISRLKNLADQGVTILIGWGYPEKDVSKWKLENRSISIDDFIGRIPSNESWKYDAVVALKEIATCFPEKLILSRPIGTHEKYIVCDNEFALITSHNFLLSDDRSKTMEIGLRTSDTRIISKLLKHSEKYFSK